MQSIKASVLTGSLIGSSWRTGGIIVSSWPIGPSRPMANDEKDKIYLVKVISYDDRKLDKDTEEKTNLAAKIPEVTANLLRAMKEAHEDSKDWPNPGSLKK